MNRIREIREALGLTSDELAARCVPPTSGVQIRRLEKEDRRLTVIWMQTIAAALGCNAAALIGNVAPGELEADVEPLPLEDVVSAITAYGLRAYRVVGCSLMNTGVNKGTTIVVNQREPIEAPSLGDIVLVEIGPERTKVLRQFVPPDLLITNRRGANLVNNLQDPSVDQTIVGVVRLK